MNLKSFLIIAALILPLSACSNNKIVEKKDAVVLIIVERNADPTAAGPGAGGIGSGFLSVRILLLPTTMLSMMQKL